MQLEDARAAIEEQLRKQEQVVSRDDLAGILSVYDPEFVYTDEDGYTGGLADKVQHWKSWRRVTTWRTEAITIRDFEQDAEQATLVEESRRESQSVLSLLGLWPGLLGGVAIIVERSRCTWRHTPGGWLRYSEHLLGWYTMSGPVPAGTLRRSRVISSAIVVLGVVAVAVRARSRKKP